MTTPTMTCEQFTGHLADFFERDVDEAMRARMERHALECDTCGPLLADLRELKDDAANLPILSPSRDLWAGIAARIETPVVELGAGAHVATHTIRRRRISLWIGAAAAGLIGIAVVIPQLMPKKSFENTPQSRQPATTLVSNRPSPQEAIDTEIRGLQAIVSERRELLDSATVAVIERNLKIIDDAIAQCEAALAQDPASHFLLESLNDALDTKVHLLRTAAMLPART